MISCGFPVGFYSAYTPLRGVWWTLKLPLRPQLTIQNVVRSCFFSLFLLNHQCCAYYFVFKNIIFKFLFSYIIEK